MQSEEPNNNLEAKNASAAIEFLYARGWGHDRFGEQWFKVGSTTDSKTFLLPELLEQEVLASQSERDEARRQSAAEPTT